MGITEVRKMAKAYDRLAWGQKSAYLVAEADRLGLSAERVRKLVSAGVALVAIESAGAQIPKTTPVRWLELVTDPQATARALKAGVPMAEAITAAPEARGVLLDEGRPDIEGAPDQLVSLALLTHSIATQLPVTELTNNQQLLAECIDVLATCLEATLEGEK